MITDSGDRTNFETGAVRDMGEGKGRPDLIPWREVIELLEGSKMDEDVIGFFRAMFQLVKNYEGGEDIRKSVHYCIMLFVKLRYEFNLWEALLELAILYEEGAKKYGERNWEKGIPIQSYINSTFRHFLKWCDDRIEENHDRAVLFNLLGILYELNQKIEVCNVER